MEEFINDYFSILNLQTMPEEILTRLRGYIAKDSFPSDTIKYWKDNYMENISTNPTKPEWVVKKDLPDIDPTFGDDLYISLFRAFKSMSRNKWAFDDNNKAIKFVDDYFGPGKLFEPQPIPGGTINEIEDVVALILNDPNVGGVLYLEREDKQTLRLFLSNTASINNNDKVKSVVYRAINNLNRQIFQLRQDGKPVPTINNRGGTPINLQNIIDELENDENVTPADLTNLQAHYKDIFSTLYKNKGIRDIFSQYDTDKTISGQIERALKLTDYTGKTNESAFIPPKYNDDLNWKQQIDKTLTDTYNNVLKKWLTAHRANIFIKPTSKAIFDALDKAKIAPTDGIKAILDKASDIENSLKGKEPFDAVKHFKWLTERLSVYSKNGMGKALEGALRNGHQMRYVIEQIIKDAVPAGKIKEAKTAMEVLSVMQYGLFTSRTMNAINKTDVNIFSDKGLSWNKTEGVRFVTSALDKTIKFGIQATGYGITAAANGLRRTNRKFNHTPGQNLQRALNKDATAKSDFEIDKNARDINDRTTIANNQAIQRNTGITDITVARTNLTAAKNNFDSLEEIFNDYNKFLSLGGVAGTPGDKQRCENDIIQLQNDLRLLPFPAPDPMVEDEINTKMKKLKTKQAELAQIDKHINNIETKYPMPRNIEVAYNDITTVHPGAAKSQYDDAKDKYEDLQQNVDDYDYAQNQIDLAQQALTDRQDILDKWDSEHQDLYTELMGYWDFLQSGNTKSLFHWSTKKLQAKMDSKAAGHTQTRMEEIYAQWRTANSY